MPSRPLSRTPLSLFHLIMILKQIKFRWQICPYCFKDKSQMLQIPTQSPCMASGLSVAENELQVSRDRAKPVLPTLCPCTQQQLQGSRLANKQVKTFHSADQQAEAGGKSNLLSVTWLAYSQERS